jgi:protein TonB
MERPSHIIFATHSRSRRLPYVGLAISFQAAALWLFAHGFSDYKILPVVHPFYVDPIQETKHPKLPPPPEPKLIKPDKVVVPDPKFTVDKKTETNTIHGEGEQKQIIVAMNPVIPDRAPVSIAATHTTPPYPPVARRMGAEGKVTLRLTVTPEGRVNLAEIVTSSGNEYLDEAAQAWIVAHWTYKPALVSGAPAASKTLASVTFSLINER